MKATSRSELYERIATLEREVTELRELLTGERDIRTSVERKRDAAQADSERLDWLMRYSYRSPYMCREDIDYARKHDGS